MVEQYIWGHAGCTSSTVLKRSLASEEDKTKMPVEHTIDWVRVLRKTDASP